MKTTLAALINELIEHGFVRTAMDINEILSKLTEDIEEDIEEDGSDGVMDPSSIVNVVGLRGDTKPEEPMGAGMTVDTLFMDTGDSF